MKSPRSAVGSGVAAGALVGAAVGAVVGCPVGTEVALAVGALADAAGVDGDGDPDPAQAASRSTSEAATRCFIDRVYPPLRIVPRVARTGTPEARPDPGEPLS